MEDIFNTEDVESQKDGVVPSKELLEEIQRKNTIDEFSEFLKNTDWIEPYLIKHYTGIEILPEGSNKFVIEQQRKEARDGLRRIDDTIT